jgi:ketosteroid isomerase-like protein
VGVALADFSGAGRTPAVQPPIAATEAALRHLVSNHCDAVNRRDVAAVTKAWADNAVWNPGGAKVVGRKAIGTAFERIFAESEWIVQSAPLMVFEVNEAEGTGTGRVTLQERSKKRKSAKPTTMSITYHDRYVRRAGTWLFAERRLEVIERG